MSGPGRGTVALIGSGEFLPNAAPLDRTLLDRCPASPHVIILPTASAPDGPGVPERWMQMGIAHFHRLGVDAAGMPLLTRRDAESPELAERIACGNFVYFSGGKPNYLLRTLRDTACWRAVQAVYDAGGVVAGCSAGAMVLAEAMLAGPLMWRTTPALGLAHGMAVVPHFDELPRWVGSILARLARGPMPFVGVGGFTGLVGHDGDWMACGRGEIAVMYRGRTPRYAPGQRVMLPMPPPMASAIKRG
jgi:cyanophycinase-like exopeptidase